MEIRISGIIDESIVDGDGVRLTVFTQGCLHNCPHCHNPNTHSLDGGHLVLTDDIVTSLQKNPLLTGITISGGEPFLQPDAVLDLVDRSKHIGKNIWVYSGFTFEQLLAMQKPQIQSILSKIDVLVDGRFDMKKRDLTLRFRGSSNQRLILASESIKAGQVVLYDES